MSDMITADLVDLDLTADTKEAAARALAERMAAQGRVTDLDGFLADVAAREAQMPTGLDGGIGIPHCRSSHVTEPTLAFGRSTAGVDFGAADGPADLIFLITAPAGADDAHLTILSSLARQLMDSAFTDALRAARDAESAAALIRGERTPAPDAPADDDTGTTARPFRIVAVTSCPTGIAHTYMAAEALENAGRDAGVELVVETQGSAGFTRLDPAVIAAADGVILAHDVPVREKVRFAGKPTVDVGVKAGIKRPAAII
ncbi:fructose PTS transporter subunit IIA, partial [Streptomyces sp. NPDC059374]|uniref:fructose PTS transporter subunit IIA n=1 Tax=Streptomyces sp. NPDC059374 TaxID=3346814 RepID=UPI0036918F4F